MGDVTVEGDLTSNSETNLNILNVGNNANLSSNLTVDGTSILKDNLTVGTTGSNSMLKVNASITTDGNISSNGNLTISGDGIIANDLTIGTTGAGNMLTIKGSLTVFDTIDFQSDLVVKKQLTVMGDTEILGNLVVGKEIAALGKIEASLDIQANGAIIADGGFQGDSAYIKNDLSVGGRIYGQMVASGITSGTIDPARLPSLNSSYTYSANSPQDFNPSWTRIMTIDKTTGGRFTPLKFNILGSRGVASGWPPNFDEDYYLRYRRDTTTEDLANTYYYD
jgi:cytoskeletal protein CcmA (bactofilin family)